ncbi:hypothetical protein Tco_1293517 [Tanacetum coccineum]
MSTAYHRTNRRAKRRTIQTLYDSCVLVRSDLGRVGLTLCHWYEFTYNIAITASIKAAPFEAALWAQVTVHPVYQQRSKAARDRQKSYADLKRKPMEFQVEDKIDVEIGQTGKTIHLEVKISDTNCFFLKRSYDVLGSSGILDSPLLIQLAAIMIALSTLSPPPYRQPHLLQGLELEMGVFAQCELQIEVHEKLVEVF